MVRTSVVYFEKKVEVSSKKLNYIFCHVFFILFLQAAKGPWFGLMCGILDLGIHRWMLFNLTVLTKEHFKTFESILICLLFLIERHFQVSTHTNDWWKSCRYSESKKGGCFIWKNWITHFVTSFSFSFRKQPRGLVRFHVWNWDIDIHRRLMVCIGWGPSSHK